MYNICIYFVSHWSQSPFKGYTNVFMRIIIFRYWITALIPQHMKYLFLLCTVRSIKGLITILANCHSYLGDFGKLIEKNLQAT